MKFDLVVFDLAGTTVRDNRDVHRMLQKAMKNSGVEVSLDDANVVMGIPKPVAIRQLLEKRYSGPREISEDWIDSIHHDFVVEMIRFYREDISVGEKEGVSQTFTALRKMGMKVFVDTGFDRLITHPLLERLGWTSKGLIDGSVTSDEVEKGRPYPDLIFEAMRQAGVSDVRRVVKVGDTASDIQEGKSAGCGLVVGVTSGAFSREQLNQEKPDYLIEQLPEIISLLQ